MVGALAGEIAFETHSPVDGCALQCYLRASAGAETLLVLLHGANLSARSFALLAEALAPVAEQDTVAGATTPLAVLAYDARGHGHSGDGAATTSLSGATLAADCLAAVRAGVAHLRDISFSNEAAAASPLTVVLVGHSMGGAVAAHAAAMWSAGGGSSASLPEVAHARLAGLTLLDVVEGSAVAALPRLRASLASLPHSFQSPEAAVEAALAPGGTLRLRASAALSVPYQLSPPTRAGAPWGWRAWPFMSRSAPFWSEWFVGTTARFLAAPCARLLLLPAVDALDADLAAAHMAGRFELRPVPGAGHVLHEDAPDKVAEALRAFLSHHGLTSRAEASLLAERLRRARAEADRR